MHRIARALQVLVGEQIEARSPHPRGAATGVATAVDGRVLEGVEAVGKSLLLRFDGGVTVHNHLRLSGRWRVGRRDGPRGGTPWLVLRSAEWEGVQWNGPVLGLGEGVLARTGPDLLDEAVDLDAVTQGLRRGAMERPLGEILLDQRLVAGIGALWMSEMLWNARLSPFAAVDAVSDTELHDALEWARRSMAAAVVGTRPLRCAYRRAGRPCPRCSAPIRSARIGEANRPAYWCERCQRR